jgi:hypothetical protein
LLEDLREIAVAQKRMSDLPVASDELDQVDLPGRMTEAEMSYYQALVWFENFPVHDQHEVPNLDQSFLENLFPEPSNTLVARNADAAVAAGKELFDKVQKGHCCIFCENGPVHVLRADTLQRLLDNLRNESKKNFKKKKDGEFQDIRKLFAYKLSDLSLQEGQGLTCSRGMKLFPIVWCCGQAVETLLLCTCQNSST